MKNVLGSYIVAMTLPKPYVQTHAVAARDLIGSIVYFTNAYQTLTGLAHLVAVRSIVCSW